jgi:predicted transglutaminase-like cysteine proteinase
MDNILSKIFCGTQNGRLQDLERILQPTFPDTLEMVAQRLKNELETKKTELGALQKAFDILTESDEKLAERAAGLQTELDKLTKPNALEAELNSKYPSKTILYPARKINGKSFVIDPRCFFSNPVCSELVNIASSWKGLADDEIAFNALRWVKKNITYTGDDNTWKTPEFWQYANETLGIKTGDCEDGAILMANLLLAAGVPYYKVRVNAGDVYNTNGVLAGGHAYPVYYCEATKKWVALDWCFYQDTTTEIINRPDYKTQKIYGGENSIWFSICRDLCFSTRSSTTYKTMLK